MKILVADYETTSFPEINSPPSADSQPEIVSMGLILADIQPGQNTITSEYYAIVEHNNWSVDEAEEVHGITLPYAAKHGIAKDDAAGFIDCFASQADLFVAHNVAFDLFMSKIALSQADADYRHLDDMTTYCTMRVARSLNTGKYNLAHCLSYHCGITRKKDDYHNAMDDARGCLELFCKFNMMGLGPVT